VFTIFTSDGEFMSQESNIYRAALGRNAGIGDLYDSSKDEFVMASIFKNDSAPNSTVSENQNTKIEFEKTDQFSEKCRKLNVDSQLGVSVLVGLVQLQGSGNYLKDTKRSSKTQRMTMMYSINTVVEHIDVFQKESIDSIDFDLLKSFPNASHVVAKIYWGANSTITAECRNEDNTNQSDITGKLEGVLNKISVATSAEVGAFSNNGERKYTSDFSFFCNADVGASEEVPVSFNEAIDFVRRIPKHIKNSRESRGKPLLYILVPISMIRNRWQNTSKENKIVEIDTITAKKLEHLFEDICSIEQELYDLISECLPRSNDLEQVNLLKRQFELAVCRFKEDFKIAVVKARLGEISPHKLDELIEDFESSGYSPSQTLAHLNSLNSPLRKGTVSREAVDWKNSDEISGPISPWRKMVMDAEDDIRQYRSGRK
jgi:hypothetical protein